MSTSTNKPSHILYHIKQTDRVDESTGKQKGFWTRIGVGFPLKDGRINVVQDYMPNCPGTLQLVPAELADKTS